MMFVSAIILLTDALNICALLNIYVVLYIFNLFLFLLYVHVVSFT